MSTDVDTVDAGLRERLVNLYLYGEKVDCYDCKYCHLIGSAEARCTSPSVAAASVSYRYLNKDEGGWESVTAARLSLDNYCGPEAKWFEPKDVS